MSESSIFIRFLVGVLSSLLFVFFDRLGALGPVRAMFETIAFPGVEVFSTISVSVSRIHEHGKYLVFGPQRIADLERRLVATQQQVSLQSSGRDVRDADDKIQSDPRLSSYLLIPASVLSASGELIVSPTEAVSVGQAVISPDGVFLGTISQLGRYMARVRLLSDSSSEVQADLLGNDGQRLATGAVIGEFGGSMSLQKILTEISVSPGQAVVTSGGDDVAPAGLLIGWVGQDIRRVESSVYQEATLDPAVDKQILRVVYVIGK